MNNNKWYKFLLTEERDYILHNLQEVYKALDAVNENNATREVLDTIDPRDFYNFLKKHNLLTIFRNYKIEGLLGTGIKGIAFSLGDPHQDYVMKMEMHYSSGERKPGVDYPQQVYNKQQKGEYDPSQVNVLESVALEGVSIQHGVRKNMWAEDVDFYLAIMTRVEQTTYRGKMPHQWGSLFKDQYQGGITTKQALNDFAFSRAGIFINMIVNNFSADVGRIVDDLRFSKFGASLPPDRGVTLNRIARSIKSAIEDKSPEKIGKVLYNAFENKFEYLSKEQFISLCRDYYDREMDAIKAGKAFSDYHGGNIGTGFSKTKGGKAKTVWKAFDV